MPYQPNWGPSENNYTQGPEVGTTPATVNAPTVVTPDQSTTQADGKKTLNDAAMVVAAAVVLLWGAVLGLKL